LIYALLMSLMSETYESKVLIYHIFKLFWCDVWVFFVFLVRHTCFTFHNCTHPATSQVPLFCSFYTFIHCSMLYCPNPSCTRNLRNTKKRFSSDKSFANHVQQSPECKPFVFDQTAVSAFTMQAPSKSASTHTTAHLFKKQRLRLNPTYAQQQPTNTTNTRTQAWRSTHGWWWWCFSVQW